MILRRRMRLLSWRRTEIDWEGVVKWLADWRCLAWVEGGLIPQDTLPIIDHQIYRQYRSFYL
jgi:hypothetical protein